MVRNTNQMGRWMAIAVAIGLVCSSETLAKPPSAPGDAEPALYDLIDLLGFDGGDFYQSVAKFVTNRDAEGGVLIYGPSVQRNESQVYEWYPAVWRVSAGGTFTEPENRGQPTFAKGAELHGFNSFGIGVGWTRFGVEQDENGDWVFPSWVDVPDLGYRELPGVIERNTHANGINDWGTIVGDLCIEDASSPRGIRWVGCLWQLDNNLVPGDPISLGDFLPTDINNFGVMAGRHLAAGCPAIAWFDDNELVVHVLETDDPRYLWADVNALNDCPVDDPRLTVVGESYEDNAGEAFAWRPFESVNSTILLGKLDGGRTSVALDVNTRGEIVGWSDTKRQGQQAFIYANGVLSNLNDRIDARNTLERAYGINDDGDIVGFMHVPRPISEQRGFLLRRNDSN